MNNRPLDIDAQIARMKAVWPAFRVGHVNRTQQSARWAGFCAPQFTRYKVEICYVLGLPPEVRVIDPPLKRLPGNPEGSLPHVYASPDDPTLCLYDPEANEWDWTMPLADTIVGWAFDWLACYEFWLINGRWEGGGRHAGDPPQAPRTGS